MSESTSKRTPTISEIKAKNAASGQHFFEPATMRFFSSRVAPGVYAGPGGTYFITSEQFRREAPRRYTVRMALESGAIDTIGEFQAYANLAAARRVAKQLAQGAKLEAGGARNAAAPKKGRARSTARKTAKRETVAAKTATRKTASQPAAPKAQKQRKAEGKKKTPPKTATPEPATETISERRAASALREMVAALNRAERVGNCEEVWAALLQAHERREKAREHLLAIPLGLAGRTENLVKTLNEADARATRIVEVMGWCKGMGGKR